MAMIGVKPKCPVCSKTELIAQIAHIINNDVREYFGQEPSRAPINNSTIISTVAQKKLDPEANWEAWKKARLDDFWKFGKTYDQKNKIHPNLVEKYDDLPEKEKIKDYVYWAVIKACVMYSDAVKTAKEGF